ncbi:hypothetical protein V8F06_012141 [Rhypophila decipiens]
MASPEPDKDSLFGDDDHSSLFGDDDCGEITNVHNGHNDEDDDNIPDKESLFGDEDHGSITNMPAGDDDDDILRSLTEAFDATPAAETTNQPEQSTQTQAPPYKTAGGLTLPLSLPRATEAPTTELLQNGNVGVTAPAEELDSMTQNFLVEMSSNNNNHALGRLAFPGSIYCDLTQEEGPATTPSLNTQDDHQTSNSLEFTGNSLSNMLTMPRTLQLAPQRTRKPEVSTTTASGASDSPVAERHQKVLTEPRVDLSKDPKDWVNVTQIAGYPYYGSAASRGWFIQRRLDDIPSLERLLEVISLGYPLKCQEAYRRLGLNIDHDEQVKSVCQQLLGDQKFNQIWVGRNRHDVANSKRLVAAAAAHLLRDRGGKDLWGDGAEPSHLKWPEDSTMIFLHFTTLISITIRDILQEAAKPTKKRNQKRKLDQRELVETDPRLNTQSLTPGTTSGAAALPITLLSGKGFWVEVAHIWAQISTPRPSV